MVKRPLRNGGSRVMIKLLRTMAIQNKAHFKVAPDQAIPQRLPNAKGNPDAVGSQRSKLRILSSAIARRSGGCLLGVTAPPIQSAAMRPTVRQNRIRQDLDRSGALAGLRVRVARAPAHDLVGSLYRFGQSPAAAPGHKFEDSRRDADDNRRPPGLLDSGKRNR